MSDDERKDTFPDDRPTMSLCPACEDPDTGFSSGMNVLVQGTMHKGVVCTLCLGERVVRPTVAEAWKREHGKA